MVDSPPAPKEDNLLAKLVKQRKWKKAQSFLVTLYGRDMASEQDEFENTILHVALGYRAPEEFLLKLIEIYPEATSVRGVDDWLPLHVAAMCGCAAEVIETLIRHYPRALDEKGSKGRTPRQSSARFAYNKEALDRTTAEWEAMTRVKRVKV
jgi:ankyrin repeat protein